MEDVLNTVQKWVVLRLLVLSLQWGGGGGGYSRLRILSRFSQCLAELGEFSALNRCPLLMAECGVLWRK